MNLVVPNADSPTQIADGVINTLKPRMALRFHGITTKRAGGCGPIACAHEHGISSMTKMIGASEFPSSWSVWDRVWRSGKTKARSCQCFSGGLESDCRYTKCHTQETTDGTSKGVAREPDVRIRIELRHIRIKLDGRAIVPILVLERFDQAGLVTGIGR